MCYFALLIFFLNVDAAIHFIYSHKYNTNSAEDSSDMNSILFRAQRICVWLGRGMSESPSR